MLIIAHRGASRDAPENTLASVNLAWTQGADAVEVDVQFSKDGHVVVIHDDNTRKTAGVARKVSTQTLAELKALDVGRWKNARWTGERIATIEEVLATIPNDRRLFIEIKCGPDCLPRLAEAYRRSGRRPTQVVLIGFSLPTMKRAKQMLPQLEVAWVAEFKRNWRGGWSPTVEHLIKQSKAAGLDALDLGAHGPWTPKLGAKVHEAGLRLYVWTVDSVAKAKQVIAAGADGITTNKPGWMRDRLVELTIER
jgi:glycerophosphoryl diester phosphodiesterase